MTPPRRRRRSRRLRRRDAELDPLDDLDELAFRALDAQVRADPATGLTDARVGANDLGRARPNPNAPYAHGQDA